MERNLKFGRASYYICNPISFRYSFAFSQSDTIPDCASKQNGNICQSSLPHAPTNNNYHSGCPVVRFFPPAVQCQKVSKAHPNDAMQSVCPAHSYRLPFWRWNLIKNEPVRFLLLQKAAIIDCLRITTIFTYKPLSLLPVFVLISAMYSCLLSAPIAVNVFLEIKKTTKISFLNCLFLCY